MSANTKFIVWDWNGTLQDDLPISVECANINLSSLGKPPIDEHVYRELFEVPIERFYRKLGLTDEELSQSLTPLQDSYFDNYDKLVASADFRPGAREILDFTSEHGIMHIILSNHLTDAITKDLHRLKKREHFREVLAWPSREMQFLHPKGDFLAAFMDNTGLRPENGIIVGDTPEEVFVARALGLVSVAISGGYNSVAVLKKAKPDFLIHSLHELKPLLEQQGFTS
jgi:phosphoglycolate phosphatase-like HAD superfamily hydrolase